MSEAEEVKLQIKTVINKEKTKLLFAEAGSDFTDVLLSFLLLPLATIVKALDKHYGDEAPVVGSLNTLYKSIANLGSIHFLSESCKKNVLTPKSPYEKELCQLRLNVDPTKPTVSELGKTYGGVLTDGAASFVITDDLRVMPIVGGSIIKTLSHLGIAVTDMDGAETRTVTFGLNEIMALLKGSLVSQNPVSALLFHRSQTNLATLEYEEGNTLRREPHPKTARR